jgi:hypothetical protein
MTDQADPHSPTAAGPISPDPTPVVGPSEATPDQPAGSVRLDPALSVDPHPEQKVGAAFAGGVAAAVFLKILANRRQR